MSAILRIVISKSIHETSGLAVAGTGVPFTVSTEMTLPGGWEVSLPDTMKVKSSNSQLSKADSEEEFCIEDALGFPVEEFGETE